VQSQKFNHEKLDEDSLIKLAELWQTKTSNGSQISVINEMSMLNRGANASLYSVYSGEYSIENIHSCFYLYAIPHMNACKNLRVFISPEKFDPGADFNLESILYLVDLLYYHFNALIEITHDGEKMKTCKIHSNDRFIALVYQNFAQKLEKELYDVKCYQDWVEISKK
jgi:hypothetical protein